MASLLTCYCTNPLGKETTPPQKPHKTKREVSQHTQKLISQTRAWQHTLDVDKTSTCLTTCKRENFQKTSSRGIWADHNSETVSSHRSEWEQKQQSSRHHRPAELPSVTKYKDRCFTVFINALEKYFLHYLGYFFFLFLLSFCPEQHGTLHSTLVIY